MKITCLLAALLLVPSFMTQAAAHVRTNTSSHRAHVGTRPPVDSRLRTDDGQALHSLPKAPQDDWPADMILGNFRADAEQALKKPIYAI